MPSIDFKLPKNPTELNLLGTQLTSVILGRATSQPEWVSTGWIEPPARSDGSRSRSNDEQLDSLVGQLCDGVVKRVGCVTRRSGEGFMVDITLTDQLPGRSNGQPLARRAFTLVTAKFLDSAAASALATSLAFDLEVA